MRERVLLRCIPLAFVTIAALGAVCASGRADVREIHNTGYTARFDGGRFEYYASGAQVPDLTYELKSVRLGNDVTSFGSSPKVTSDREAVCYHYGDVISESYTALEKGVEQCWVINRRPRAPGGIVIEGLVRSPHKATSSLSGLRFRGARGRIAFIYGSVTVVDGRGKTHKCLPQLRGESLTIAIPASYVASAQFPLLVDPVIGPEVPLCPSYSAAPGVQEHAEIATGANGYLAVWQDSRSGKDVDIFATRLSSTGEVLDKAGICISAASGDQTDPAVSWNGREYLVVWSDKRGGTAHIYSARVRPDGEVLDKQGVLISGTNGVQAYPRAASDGSAWFVVWQDAHSSSYDIYGCKVDGTGGGGSVYSIATRADNEEFPDVAYNGSTYLVVWRDCRNSASTGTDIYGCRVGKTGVRLATDVLISCDSAGTSGVAGAQSTPRVCAYGTSWMVVWQDYRTDSTRGDIYGTRVSSSASVLNRGGIALSVVAGDKDLPTVAYNGTRLLVAWRNKADRQIKGTRVDTNGTVRDNPSLVVSTSMAGSSSVAVASFAGKFFVGWSNLDPSEANAVSALISDSGGVQAPAGSVISTALNDQRDFAVASNGSEYAVVWSEVVGGSSDILAIRVSYSGQVLTPTPVNLTSAVYGNQTQPSIAWNGSKYLVVWSTDVNYAATGWDVQGCRLQSNLALIDLTAIPVCSAMDAQTRPHVASNGSNFLVVWEDARNALAPNYYTDLYGATVATNGSLTPIGSAISMATGDQRSPRIASDLSNYFVVWEDYRAGYPQVRGSRITSTGVVQDASGIAFPATSYQQGKPVACFGGGNYYVAWSDYYSITGCRVSTTGVVQEAGGVVVSNGSTMKLAPCVCWDGNAFRVAWEDYRSTYWGNSDLYYTTVGANGVVSSSPESALVSDLTAQTRPRVFASGNSGILLYSRYDNFVNCTCAASLTEQPINEAPSIAAAKQLPAGAPVSIKGKVVTGAFQGFFYIEESDRSSGIKVLSAMHVSVGDIVDATGTVSISDGERQITASVLSAMGVAGDLVRPIGMRTDVLGGARLNSYTPGITGGFGANNIGLLVTTWGKVSSLESDGFYLESKSTNKVKVKCGSLVKPQVGKIVTVTGISTCEVTSGAIGRAIRPREQADIAILR